VLPFIRPWSWSIGPIDMSSWLLFVCLGIVIGTVFGTRRAERLGLSVKTTADCTLFMVGGGFVMAHIFAVLLYSPDASDWKLLLPWYSGWSSLGGFVGAALAIWIFLKLVAKVPFWTYLDNIAVGFALGWALGRTGCATAHDHIGRATTLWTGVAFPDDWPRLGDQLGVRHDLGLYEALLCYGIFALLVLLGRRQQVWTGLQSGAAAITYGLGRFGLDFLRATDMERAADRVSDPRYFGLTAAQYAMLVVAIWGVWIVATRRGTEAVEAQQPEDGPTVADRSSQSQPADG
jgi:phosphatidylglycerol---prolipoprotein diacylglyceryl transferase